MARPSSLSFLLALLAALAVALAQDAPLPEGTCPGFGATLGMLNYTNTCNACFTAGCGICSPPANKANQLGAASCLKDASFCHNPRFFKAEDNANGSLCHVTIIPFAAVVGVLVGLVLCCGCCTGYCCYTLQKQRKLKRMIKAKQAQGQGGVGAPGAIHAIPPQQTDHPTFATTTPVARNV